MSRIKRGVTVKRRHKKLFKATKGYKHGRKNIVRLAKQAVLKAKGYSYRDRKVKKRTFRALWIVRLNAAVRPHGLVYRDFIYGLKKADISLDRKSLAYLATANDPAFEKIVSQVKAVLAKEPK
jgi:large subunit ribosomal protein L20